MEKEKSTHIIVKDKIRKGLKILLAKRDSTMQIEANRILKEGLDISESEQTNE